MKCWYWAFNAQGSRPIPVVGQLGAVKICVAAAVEALRKKERQDETQFTTKIDGFVGFIPRTFLGHSEPAPTSAPSRMDDMWSGNSFLLGSSSLANHGG